MDWSEGRGTIAFAGGQCTLQAGPRALVLSLEADDDETLQRIQTLLGRRLETIGRRDGLRVPWTPRADSPRHEPVPGVRPARPRRRRLQVVAVAAALALVVVVHLGLGRAVLTSTWTGWTVAAVGLILLAKATVLMLGHARLRRRP